MHITFKNLLIAMLCLAMIGNAACTSLRTIDPTASAVQEQGIEAGDEVELRYKDHSARTITVTAVDESGISGVDAAGETVTAAYEDLRAVTFTAVDGKKTAKNTAKAVGIAALVAIAAIASIAAGYGGIPAQ